jgi:hypothetical protein
MRKGRAQVFCERLFRTFGHVGYKEAGAALERIVLRLDQAFVYLELHALRRSPATCVAASRSVRDLYVRRSNTTAKCCRIPRAEEGGEGQKVRRPLVEAALASGDEETRGEARAPL